MLDPAFVRDHLEEVQAGLRRRGLDAAADLESLATLEAARRRVIPEVEGIKRDRNAVGNEVARAKRQGLDAAALVAANKARAEEIGRLEAELEGVEEQRTRLLLTLPNLPHATVPEGGTSADNQEVRCHGEPPLV